MSDMVCALGVRLSQGVSCCSCKRRGARSTLHTHMGIAVVLPGIPTRLERAPHAPGYSLQTHCRQEGCRQVRNVGLVHPPKATTQPKYYHATKGVDSSGLTNPCMRGTPYGMYNLTHVQIGTSRIQAAGHGQHSEKKQFLTCFRLFLTRL
jgi:hypothetical protein